MEQSLQIVGGGLAGLTLGIALRRQGVPVCVWEAGNYPRHRVCGEFISGRGVETLSRLGLLPVLEAAGAREARSAAFFLRDRCLGRRTLPEPALCLSRFVMDRVLAETFQQLGGVLRCRNRWSQTLPAEWTVYAGGRQMTKGSDRGWHWYGLKAHVTGVELDADLELHFDDDAYVGFCRLRDGCVNVCGLFRRKGSDPALPKDLKMKFLARSAGILQERFRRANWDEASACSVAAVPLQPGPPPRRAECRIGDAFAVIPPFTGNGMSMAFESAELAAVSLHRFARGLQDWGDTCRTVHRALQRRFATRFFWSGFLQRNLFDRPRRRRLLLHTLARAGLWRFVFHLTR